MVLNNKEYDSVKHLELLNYSKELKKKGKSISGDDASQLLHYSAMVYCQLNWQIRDQYFEIFKNFQENKISNFELCQMLEEKLTESDESCNTVEFNSIDEIALKFTDILDDLSVGCQICDRSAEEDRSANHISETELSEEIKEAIIELQKFTDFT